MSFPLPGNEHVFFLTCVRNNKVQMTSLIARDMESAYYVAVNEVITPSYGFDDNDLNYAFNNGITTIWTPDKRFRATII